MIGSTNLKVELRSGCGLDSCEVCSNQSIGTAVEVWLSATLFWIQLTSMILVFFSLKHEHPESRRIIVSAASGSSDLPHGLAP